MVEDWLLLFEILGKVYEIGLLTKTKTKAKDNAVFRLRYFISLFSFFSAFFSVYEVDDVCRL